MGAASARFFAFAYGVGRRISKFAAVVLLTAGAASAETVTIAALGDSLLTGPANKIYAFASINRIAVTVAGSKLTVGTSTVLITPSASGGNVSQMSGGAGKLHRPAGSKHTVTDAKWGEHQVGCIAVQSVDGGVEVGLFGLGRNTRRRSSAHDVDHDDGNFSGNREADALDHQREAGTGGCGE